MTTAPKSPGFTAVRLDRAKFALDSFLTALASGPHRAEMDTSLGKALQIFKLRAETLRRIETAATRDPNNKHIRKDLDSACADMLQWQLVVNHWRYFGRPPRLSPPVTFNEHILHKIIYDRDPKLRMFCDKLAVRSYVERCVGSDYVVPVLGAWRHPSEIRFDKLPPSFVLKANHGSNFFLLINKLSDGEMKKIFATAQRWLDIDYFDVLFEWGYKDLPRWLVAEPVLYSSDSPALLEASVHTFNGTAKLIRIHCGTKFSSESWQCFTDIAGRWLALKEEAPEKYFRLDSEIRKEMIFLSERVSVGIPHLRVDFFLTDHGIKIGELTPYPGAGFNKWSPQRLDEELGKLWDSDYDISTFPDHEQQRHVESRAELT
ncbi:MAG TPA: ATP-grasp fold amidoligase family protein [Methylocystis sp.]|nr:ATP-grasp fold amidoligase family protein [Methylocystis sp.]